MPEGMRHCENKLVHVRAKNGLALFSEKESQRQWNGKSLVSIGFSIVSFSKIGDTTKFSTGFESATTKQNLAFR